MSRLATPVPQARSREQDAFAPAPFLSAPAATAPARASLVPPVHGEIRAPTGTTHLKVSIHVPVCNEPPQIVCESLDALSRLDYPDFEVLVIDSNTDDPALWEPVARHCARLGSRFRFFHLGAWPGFRAGALNFALGETAANAAIIGVIGSGVIVSPEWLRSMVPAFADPKLGVAQSPLDSRDSDGTLFRRLMSWEYTSFSRLGTMSCNGRGPIIAPRAMSLIRAGAIRTAGGWAEWCLEEETELGLRLMRQGWQGISARESFGKGAPPDDFVSWRRQHFSRAYGAMRIGEVHWRALLSPFSHDLSSGQRWRFLIGWLPWLGDGLGLLFLLAGLAWSVALILSPRHIAFPILPFMLSALGLATFRHAGLFRLHRGPMPRSLDESLGEAVGSVIAGLARSHATGKAALWGLTAQPVPLFRVPQMRDAPWFAPWFVQGLAAAREESCLLLLTWAAAIGVATTNGLTSGKVKLWCLTLLIQSLPYLAAVSVSILAALPPGDDRARAKKNVKYLR